MADNSIATHESIAQTNIAHQEQIRSRGAAGNAPHQEPLLPTTATNPSRMRFIPHTFRDRESKPVAWSSWWWWEIGGAVVALTCLFATIAVLAVLNNKIIDDWQFKIQPSSLLSTLVTVGKMGLTLVVASCVSQLKWSHFQEPNPLSHLDVLDDVSRAGVWNTAIIFMKIRRSLLKRGPDFMIALFALITLGSFAIDPMIQQILDTQQDDFQLTNITASIMTNKRYDARVHNIKASLETHNNPQANGTQLIIHESSFLSQLTSTALRPDLDCPFPGTRCEFENISMLGLCSEFSDITNKTERDCTRENSKSMDCTYQLNDMTPNRILSINFGGGNGVVYENFRSILENFDDLITMAKYGRKRVDVARLFTIKVVGEVTGNDFLNDSSLDPPETQVTMTNWYWCQRKYTGFSTNGRSDNTSITGEAKTEPLLLTEPPLGTDPSNVYKYATKEELDALSNDSTSMPTSYTTNFYREDFKTLFGIIDAKWQQFLDPNTKNTQLQQQVSTASNKMDPESYVADTIGVASFMVNANMSELAERMAMAVTNQVQQKTHNTIAEMTNGTVHEKTAYYRVRWGWLALPLLEVVAAAVLLFITILLNKLPLLKASSIGMLAHGPENAVEYRIDGTETMGKWGKFGDRVTVMLMKDEKGWTRLIQT